MVQAWLFVLSFLFSMNSVLATAIETIPETWKNNPRLKKIYKVKRDFQVKNPSGHAYDFKVGDKVVISQRGLHDNLEKEHKRFDLDLVNTREEPDFPKGAIPPGDLNKDLELTDEVAPLTSWQKAYQKAADQKIPNIKPNFYYQTTYFPLSLAPAQKYEKERPYLIADGIVYRLIKPSPHCKDDELTIRLRYGDEPYKKDPYDYYEKLRVQNPQLIMVGRWYGSDYCLPFVDFINENSTLVAGFGDTYSIVDSNLPDSLNWEDVEKKFLSGFADKVLAEKVIRVSQFSERDEKANRAGPPIRVYPVSALPADQRKGLPENGWVAQYGGPLYYACSGGVCRAQGYKIALTAEGKLDSFIENRLYVWNGHHELNFEKSETDRLLAISNDKDLLKKAYDWAAGKQSESYTANMSQLSKMELPRRAGNAFGTFIIHLSKVREKLALKEWPFYDGPAPGGDALIR